MTVLLSCVRDDLAITISDRRLNIDKNQSSGYSDDANKLREFGYGWATGSGLYDVTNNVVDELISEGKKGSLNIEEVYRQKIEVLTKHNPHLTEDIKNTITLLSWLDSNKTFQTGFLQGGRFRTLNKKKIFVVYPEDFVIDQEKVEKIERDNDFNIDQDKSIQDILGKLFNIYEEISDGSNYVSKYCDVGILFFDNKGINKIRETMDIEELVFNLKAGAFDDL
ncbi:hypothetical protein [Bacillus sp. SD088]|uniref:hypothetical protein n=1 Tax=Bacillus sp. SD088 TaxID=2782012 RepID=UPI001A9762D1|nr:hypothetical protein [Bacillus sp. SD088]MBO0995922.1 hypothetical protein [Bacillus sp. SD088]